MGTDVALKKKVLIVDDEPAIGKVLGIRLRLLGYEVICATNGIEAIDLVRTQAPDIVLLDVVMPGVSGFEVLSRIRKFTLAPVIVFTGRSEVFQLALELGANDSIGKPCDPDELEEKIKCLIGTSGAAGGERDGPGQ